MRRLSMPHPPALNPDLAPTVNIPVWSERVDLDSLRFLGKKMVSYGLVEQQPDAAAAVHAGS